MTKDTTDLKSWINITSSILAGWNIFLICIFLLVILISIVLSSIGMSVIFGDVYFYVEIIIAGIISLVPSYLISKNIFVYLKNIKTVYQLIILLALVVSTFLIFPSTFNYNL